MMTWQDVLGRHGRWMIPCLLSQVLVFSVAAVPPANRTVRINDGVMRWTDDGNEVAVFGVNYYTPFALDYRLLGERGIDRKETIRRDVAHFRRLGLTAVRLHVFDREISNRDGSLRDNDHLALLDYLIFECASNGIYTVLTPIAAWGGHIWTTDTRGFAYPVTMAELTTNRSLWPIQARYEEEFVRHVNRYTGHRYADDPAVLCFELINEPAYTNHTPSSVVAEFANTLLDGIRRSGTKKPVLYSATWNNRNACVPELRTDGVTGVYYATGLRAGSSLPGLQLSRVRESSLKPEPRLEKMVKVIYEFDAADTPGAYMYPAMAAVFRSEGVQAATQFQYEATPLGSANESYHTHYLNLVYTPAKAISLAIAAEVFRRMPRGTPYRPDANEVVFPPFRVNASRNLSEMVTETALYYTATPMTPVPAPEKLERVWGCGTSSVVSSSGSGAYFLDRVAEGLWRLQIYPNVMPVSDPHVISPKAKTVVLAGDVTLKVALPDLGDAFGVRPIADDGSAIRAADGAFTVAPGDYILSREPDPAAARLAEARAAAVAPYCAPPPDPPGDYQPWPAPLEVRAKALAERVARRDAVNLLERPVRIKAPDYRQKGFWDVRRTVDIEALLAAFPSEDAISALVFEGRSLVGHDEPVEIACTFADGSVWGCEVKFPQAAGELRIEAKALRHFPSWDKMPDPPQGTVPRLDQLVCFSFALGEWMEKNRRDIAHGVEISEVRLCGNAWRPDERWRGFNLLGMFLSRRHASPPPSDPTFSRSPGYFTEDEFRWIHEWGFNFARLPLDYRCWIKGDDWNAIDEESVKKIDEAIGFGKKYGVHVQLCFHRAPGFCINPPKEPKDLFSDVEALDVCAKHWGYFAKRYKGVPNSELSFDLFNEPSYPESDARTNIVRVVRRLIDEIRKADPGRMVFVDGYYCGRDPISELYATPEVAQSLHAYDPFLLSHFKAPWLKDDFREMPVWPLKGVSDGVEWLERNCYRKWDSAEAAGAFLFVGECGCYAETPHAVMLSWMEDQLKVWKRRGYGWALWNLRGRFGILDSDRTDVNYEDFEGHLLDRKYLRLLQKY